MLLLSDILSKEHTTHWYEEMSSRNPKSKISEQCFDDGLMMLEQHIPKVDALEQRLDALLEGTREG